MEKELNGDFNFCDKPNRISTFKNEQKGKGKDRRKHPRVVLDLPLEYRVTDIPDAYGALVANGSERGLLVESVRNIPVGTNLNIVVLFPTHMNWPISRYRPRSSGKSFIGGRTGKGINTD